MRSLLITHRHAYTRTHAHTHTQTHTHKHTQVYLIVWLSFGYMCFCVSSVKFYVVSRISILHRGVIEFEKKSKLQMKMLAHTE